MGAKTAAILLSRQPLGACGSSAWVSATLRATSWVRERGYTLVTSVGMQTWELLCAASATHGVPQIVLIPARDSIRCAQVEKEVREGFGLDSSAVCEPVIDTDRAVRYRLRDEEVATIADILVPISLRPGGAMQAVVDRLRSRKEVIDHFRVPYDERRTHLKYEIPTADLNRGLTELPKRYLIHWTRANYSPWPDERPIDFYRGLVASDHPPHSALDTLQRIVRTRRLIASRRHMPGGVAAVSFSALPPAGVVPLMRWRARYCRMSFEPYGLGIESETARHLGLDKVYYYDPGRGEKPPADSIWRSQSVGTRTDWTQEAEYRCRGDLDLAKVPNESLLLFCRTPAEAGAITAETGLACLSMLTHDPSGS